MSERTKPCSKCKGTGRVPLRKRDTGVIPIMWRTCTGCGKRYDEGNAMAHFHHVYNECSATPEREE